MRYPGSARLVWELAKRKRSKLEIEVWDIDPDVAKAWSEYPETTSLSFHLGDGFSGVMSLLNEAIPGLLLIDPPFLDPKMQMLQKSCLTGPGNWDGRFSAGICGQDG